LADDNLFAAYDRMASIRPSLVAPNANMQTDKRDELSAIRDYYDHNTLRFLSYSAQRKTGTIHRPVWGEDVENNAQALHYVDLRILNEAHNLWNPDQIKLRVADLGCGVGASLFYLARNFGESLIGIGITISPVQAELAQEKVLKWKLTDRCKFILGDFLAPPLAGVFDLVYSIESFAHTRDAEQFFLSASQLLKKGGRFVLCDDFLGSGNQHSSLNSQQKRMLEAFRWGWNVSSVKSILNVADLAKRFGLDLIENLDLTSYLKLRPIPASLLKMFLNAYRISGIKDLYWQSMLGGQALQLCLSQGLVEYRYLVFERSIDHGN
jgi:SAM-dependent methyltransferase